MARLGLVAAWWVASRWVGSSLSGDRGWWVLRRRGAAGRAATAVTTSPASSREENNESYVLWCCSSGPEATARFYLGENETLFSRYVAGMGWRGREKVRLGPSDAEWAEALWRRGELVVSDRETWRKLVKSASALPTAAALEKSLEGGAARATALWRALRRSDSKDVAAAKAYLEREGFAGVATREALQDLLDHFKAQFPYYHDQCDRCGERGSAFFGEVACVSDEEVLGRRAKRAELRICEACGAVIRFVRANDVQRVLADRRGRCGEYSTAMLALAVALDLEARWIFDTTDHVWVELELEPGTWIHVDPCEAALDQPGLYQSWGKNGSLVVAFERHRAVDVTLDYYASRHHVQHIRDKHNLTDAKIQATFAKYASDSYESSPPPS